MILFKSTGYWSTGISIQKIDDKWSVSLDYKDDGWAGDEGVSTEGHLRCRYGQLDLSAAIDTLKADAERLGITFDTGIGPRIYYPGDGEWKDVEYPEGWRLIADAQAVRLGWQPMYGALEGSPA